MENQRRRSSSVTIIKDLWEHKTSRERKETPEEFEKWEKDLLAFKRSQKIPRMPNKMAVEKPEPQEKTTVKEIDAKEEVPTTRDPQKEQYTKQRPEKMEMEELKKLFTELRRDIKEDMDKNKKELIAEISMLKNEMKRKEEEWKAEKKDIPTKIANLEDKIEQLDKEKRKKNIIITGLHGNGGNTFHISL